MHITFDGITFELGVVGKLQPTPHWTIAAHEHHLYEMHFITEGRGVNFVSGGELEFAPHLVYLAPPFESHAQCSDLGSPLGLYFVLFRLEAEGVSQPLSRIYAPFSFAVGELDAIYQDLHQPSMTGRFLTRLRLIELIVNVIKPYMEIAHNKTTGVVAGATSGASSGVKLLEQAFLYIQSHFLRNPSVAEIASACHVSERHLSRLFTAYYGMTVHDVVQRERASWAAVQLLHSPDSTAQIAERLHMGSMSYFSQWFRQQMKQTPKEYKETFRKRMQLGSSLPEGNTKS